MTRRPRPDPKLDALRESGTLNPRPAGVADETFRASDFFDARAQQMDRAGVAQRMRADALRGERRGPGAGLRDGALHQAGACLSIPGAWSARWAARKKNGPECRGAGAPQQGEARRPSGVAVRLLQCRSAEILVGHHPVVLGR